jgi:hypothetical protein
MSKKTAKPKPHERIKTTNPLIVLFGLDEKEQPRGAHFKQSDEVLLTRMAAGLGLRIGVAQAAHQLALAGQLPKGDVHATGNKAVPTIPLELYEKLNALVGGDTGVISSVLPRSFDKIEPGHLVIAQDSLPDGWWPAIIRKKHERNLVLIWRDFPGQGEFIRDVNSVALLKYD